MWRAMYKTGRHLSRPSAGTTFVDSPLRIINGQSGVLWISRSASMWVGAESPATGSLLVGWVRAVRGGRGIREEVVTEGVWTRRVGFAFFAEECLGMCRGVLGTKI